MGINQRATLQEGVFAAENTYKSLKIKSLRFDDYGEKSSITPQISRHPQFFIDQITKNG